MSAAPANAAAPAAVPDDIYVPPAIEQVLNDTLGWLNASGVEMAIGAGVGTAIVLGLMAARGFLRGLAEKRGASDYLAIVARALGHTSSFFIVMVAVRLVSGFAAAPPTIETTIRFLFTVAAVFQGAVWARELVIGFVERRTSVGEHAALGSALNIIKLLVTALFFAIALLVVLDNLGVNITGLVAGLGVGGIAIGLAAKGVFEDLFAALSILFDRPFRQGDSIDYDNTSGTVEAIGLKSTRLRSVTGEERIISNRNLLDKEIRNSSRRNARRFKFALGLVYQTDPKVATALPQTLKEIVEGEGHVFVRAGFTGFGDSSLDFELQFDVVGTDYAVAYAARHAVGIAILTRFNAMGLEFAYPTQTSFMAAPDGRAVMPYPDVLPVHEVGMEGKAGGR